VKKGLYANSIDARVDYEAKNAKRDIEFVAQPFSEAPDSVITFSDSELKSYFARHKEDKDYVQKESSDFSFVTFDVVASAADSSLAQERLTTVQSQWEESANDSAFVISKSRFPFYNPEKYKDDGTSNALNVMKTTTAVGSFFGPYFNNGQYALSKVVSRGEIEQRDVRQMMIPYGGDKDAAISIADSLLRIVNTDNFGELSRKHSKDPKSQTGGKLGFVSKDMLPADIADAVFGAVVNKFTIAQAEGAAYLFEVQEKRTENQTKIASVTEEIKASNATITESFNVANEFSIEANNEEEFNARAEAEGLIVTEITKQQPTPPNVQGLGNAPDVVSWSLLSNTEIGDVSSPRLVNDKYVVILSKAKRAAGMPNFVDVIEKVEADLIKEKKQTYFADLMSKGSNLDEVAEAIGGEVKTAAKLRMSANALPQSNAGTDPKAVGGAFSLETGYMSTPIVGDNGVYVIAAQGDVASADEKDDYSDEKKALSATLQRRTTKIFNAEKEARKVSDLKNRF